MNATADHLHAALVEEFSIDANRAAVRLANVALAFQQDRNKGLLLRTAYQTCAVLDDWSLFCTLDDLDGGVPAIHELVLAALAMNEPRERATWEERTQRLYEAAERVVAP